MPGPFPTLEEVGREDAGQPAPPLCPQGIPGETLLGVAQPHVPISPCPPVSPSCPGTRSRAGCPPPSPGAVWGRGAGARPHLAAERQSRVFPTRLPDSRQGLPVLGAQDSPLSTCLTEDRLILQKHQHRAADLHQTGQMPAGMGGKSQSSPSRVPTRLAGLGVPPARPPPYPLGRKLLCHTVEMPVLACTARSITNTSASSEPTACCWMPRAHCRGHGQGSPLSWSPPCPQVPSPCPPMLSTTLLTGTSRNPPWHPQPDPDPPPHRPPRAGGSRSWRCRGGPWCRWPGR